MFASRTRPIEKQPLLSVNAQEDSSRQLPTKACARRRLTDGTKLVTLRDAVNVLLDAANAQSGGLDNAIRLLLLAAKTGKRADMVEATEAIERVLRARRLL